MAALLPDVLPLWAAASLTLLSFFTSFLAAAVGLGGGVIMLAVMAILLPPAAIIPVHAVVQIGSNAGRAMIMRRDIERKVAGLVIAGSVIGAILGGMLVVELPTGILLLAIGLFILQTQWLPLPKMAKTGKPGLLIGGAISSFLTMFLGATGPFLAAFTRPLIPAKERYVASHAAMMTIQHGLKIIVFGVLGFAFAPWLPLLIAMIGFGFLGTLAGRSVLLRLPDHLFNIGLKWVLTVAALRLIWDGVGQF